jgi:UDP-N-acetyl-D-glucosamine dehydrogenase
MAEAISNRSARIAVIGLGHVGLVEAVTYAEAGFTVTGYDINENHVSALNGGHSHLSDIDDSRLAQLVESGRLAALPDPEYLKDKDIYVITVPTLLTKERNPDVRAVINVADLLSGLLSEPALVILTSTCYPGTTEEILIGSFMEHGKQPDADFWAAYAPARIDPGNREWPITKIPKIVAGATPESSSLAISFYDQVMDEVVPAPSLAAAEMTKLLENAYRLINIAFIEEMARVCRQLSLDIWKIIELAATKPFGFTPFYPGPGPGGTCIPVDPFYIAWLARTKDCRAEFIELAGEVIDEIPALIIRRIYDLLNRNKTALNGAKILLLGVAYKKDTAEIAGSAAPRLIKLLSERGAKVEYHDPLISGLTTPLGPYSSVELSQTLLNQQDAIVLLTDHTDVDYDQVVKHSKMILDMRNRLAGFDAANIFR